MIIAVDFDGTLFEDAYPSIGAPKTDVIDFIKYHKSVGDTIILWTCRYGSDLAKALAACTEVGLTFDCVNENAVFDHDRYSGESRKIYADIYIDDHGMHPVRDFSSKDSCRFSIKSQDGITTLISCDKCESVFDWDWVIAHDGEFPNFCPSCGSSVLK